MQKPASHRQRWEAIERSFEGSDEKRVAALRAALDAVAKEAWAAPARDLDDVRLLAEIAYNYQPIAEGHFPMLPPDLASRPMRDVAVGHLLRAIDEVTRAQPETPSATPIAKAVREIVDLDEVYNAADAAQTDLGRQRKAEPRPSLISDAALAIENTIARYKAIEKAAFERNELWKSLLLTMEPETLDDALSVLLVATSAVEGLVDNHVTERDEPEAQEIVQRIEGALNAVVRSLIRHGGARSLLLDRFTAPADLIPWDEGVKAARAAAAEVYAPRGAIEERAPR